MRKRDQIPVLYCHVVGYDAEGKIVKRLEAYSEQQALQHMCFMQGKDGVVDTEAVGVNGLV